MGDYPETHSIEFNPALTLPAPNGRERRDAHEHRDADQHLIQRHPAALACSILLFDRRRLLIELTDNRRRPGSRQRRRRAKASVTQYPLGQFLRRDPHLDAMTRAVVDHYAKVL